jgi:hypothetical protein
MLEEQPIRTFAGDHTVAPRKHWAMNTMRVQPEPSSAGLFPNLGQSPKARNHVSNASRAGVTKDDALKRAS